ncbi:MAG TPA: FkbM family methyltransferase, partial [Chitinophagaceae bacterium]
IKIYLKLALQKLLGFENYLLIFSLFTIYRHRIQVSESDFKHFLSLIPEDGNVLDIGSNIGVTAMPIAKRVKGGRVFCFEPLSIHIRILRKIIRHFRMKNVEIFETALGEKNEQLVMVMPEFHKVKFQGFTHVTTNEADRKKGRLFNVPVQKLDDNRTMQDLSIIHAIKIDVENFEYHVLKGAEKLIVHHKPLIFCELWNDEKKIKTISYLTKELGYCAMVFENSQLVDFTNQSRSNYFFIRK